MKARVKSNEEIVDVYFDKDALANDYPPYRTNEIPSRFFLAEQLEWIDIKEKAEPDYWTLLEHTYAGMAMQGLVTRGEVLGSSVQEIARDIAEISCEVAHALVEKMKNQSV